MGAAAVGVVNSEMGDAQETPTAALTDESSWQFAEWYEEFPVINIFYNFLFDDVPTMAMIRTALEVLALISALLLTIGFALPLGFSYDEIMQHKARFEPGGVYHACVFCNSNSTRICWEQPEYQTTDVFSVDNLVVEFMMVAVGSSCTLIGVAMIYVFGAHSNFKTKHSHLVWWRYIRWVLLVCVVSVVVSVSYLCLALKDTVQIKFPDFWIQRNGCPMWTEWQFSSRSSWGYSLWMQIAALFPITSFTTVILSLAVRAKYRSEAGLADMPWGVRHRFVPPEGSEGMLQLLKDLELQHIMEQLVENDITTEAMNTIPAELLSERLGLTLGKAALLKHRAQIGP